MLIQRQQAAQRIWGRFVPADQHRRPVTGKMPVWFIAVGRPQSQRFGLCHSIDRKCFMAVPRSCLIEPGGWLHRHQNINGDDIERLMQPLKKTMLRVGSRRPPEQRASRPLQAMSLPVNSFAIAFHFELLRPCWQLCKALVIGDQPIGRPVQITAVPDTQQPHNDADIRLQFSLLNMTIHGIAAGQQACKIIPTNGNHRRQTDRRPERITSANTLGKGKNMLRINAPFAGPRASRSDRDHGFAGINTMLFQPVSGNRSIRHGFGCGKSF